MEQQPKTLVPPKACPVCSVAMQATETKERIVYRCENCGMIITVVSGTMAKTHDWDGLNMTEELNNPSNRVELSANHTFLAFWRGRVVYENGRVKHFETERDAWQFLARCDAAGKIIH
jgi:hypothetical protein